MNQDSSQNEKSPVARREEEILKFWQENRIFEKSLEKQSPLGEYIFYDGPPFATGLPHYGHILASAIKDVIPRYKTMKGYHVPRRWGWDCHGLPLENIVEKELDLQTKKDIEEYGIKKFNETAREAVLRYAADWKRIIPRIGRWVDMENDYKTMDATYSETIWWIFKSLHDKGLIYEGYKPMHICPRCETTLANFEVNQGYKDITDISVYVKFELADEPGTYLLAWTTTPWTLPGNVALAVNPDVEYVKAEKEGAKYVLAKALADKTLKDGFTVVEELKGADLAGKKYKPVFDYYQDPSLANFDRGWKVYGADFVTTEDGTGIVHIAPAFGEDDMRLGQREDLPFIQHVGMDGRFKLEVEGFAGQPVKPKDDHQKADIEIIKRLAGQGALFAKEKIVHSYPHCWRCDTPLLNYAASSWFVKVTDIKEELLKSNQAVSWVPEHIKEGRFGKWLEGARDWAISRSRFWGAPIPVWKCKGCGESKVFGSVQEMAKAAVSSGNEYIVMRHGEAEHNVKNIISGRADNDHHLTEVGRTKAKASAEELKERGIDLIVASDFVRTRETAEIVRDALGLPADSLVFDERLREVDFGDFEGKSVADYHAYQAGLIDPFEDVISGGESYRRVHARAAGLLRELERIHKNKRILLVTHEALVWLLEAAGRGLTAGQIAEIKSDRTVDYVKPGEFLPLTVLPVPYNDRYELDLHRPYVDDVRIACACGGSMERVPDVFDCWFESGSMPYGQMHYPFENRQAFDPETNLGFPADFIAEGLDQTRGWFYSLMVLGTALFGKSPFKNVIVNGLVLAEDGQKMSKKLKNYPDLMEVVDKYGADALRLYMIGSPIVRGEDLNFSEKGVGEVYRKVVMRLLNSYAFYETYAGEAGEAVSDNVLDRWIMSRLSQLVLQVEREMESYELDRALRPIDEFVDDLSNWHVRRSRDRFKTEDEDDRKAAASTMRQVFVVLSKVMAPFAPFTAEAVFQKVKGAADAESVHLEAWPEAGAVDEAAIEHMAAVREIVSLGLEARAAAGIKVRQPLGLLHVGRNLGEEYFDLVRDEINVKQVIVDPTLGTEVRLDPTITPDLKEEGQIREFVRQVQDLRKQSGLNPGQRIRLFVATGEAGRVILGKYEPAVLKGVSASEIVAGEVEAELEIEIDDMIFKVALEVTA